MTREVHYLLNHHRFLCGPYISKKLAIADIERIVELLGGLGITGVKIDVYTTNDYAKPTTMFPLYGP